MMRDVTRAPMMMMMKESRRDDASARCRADERYRAMMPRRMPMSGYDDTPFYHLFGTTCRLLLA